MELDKSKARWLLIASTLLLLLFTGSIVLAYGQQPSPSPPAPPPPPANDGGPPSYRHWNRDFQRDDSSMPLPLRSRRPPLERLLRVGPPGRWWDNPDFAAKLNLTAEQQKKMDDIFQQSRLNLIDLMAAVQKQEVIMEPLLSADQPDEGKIIAQIDRVAQARADLEKSNARMLLGLRRVLTQEQWQKLQAEDRERDRPRDHFRHGPELPAGPQGHPGPPAGPS